MPAVPRTEMPIFRVNLHPPRSLGRRAARNIVIAMACVTSTIGLIFWLVGAWPVIGFLGDDRCELYLRSHGKRFEIGGFLGAEEKTDLAGKLDRLLRQARCSSDPRAV